MIEINLLPGAGRRSGRRQTADLLSSAVAWAGDKYLLGALGAVAAAIALTGFLYVHQNTVAAVLNERQIKAVEDSARYSAVIAAKTRAEATRDSLMQQLAIIQSIDDTRFLWSHLMQEISAALPPYTWLTAITQTSIPPSAAAADTTRKGAGTGDSGAVAGSKAKAAREKEKRARADSLLAAAQSLKFRIVGNTVDIQALTRFMKALEASPFIQNVQLTRSDLVVNEGREVTEFQLEAETQHPSPYIIKTVPFIAPAGGG